MPRPLHPAARLPPRLLRLASDERLVDLVRAGSESAFEAIFDRHHRGILAFCRHMLGSPDEAEDAVQHTFLAAYADLTGSLKPIQLRAWLYTIARNRCTSILRARREHPVDDLEELATEHLSAAVQRRQDLRDLLRDVKRLPESQRAALVLAEVGDVSHREIAAVLGVRPEKVKALVFQARSSLIATRTARDTPCADIRAQLVELHGSALRRGALGRHVNECPGCRDFRAAIRNQRRMLALALPVVPTLALKGSALAGALGGGAAAAGAGGAGAAGGGAVGAGAAGGGTALTAKVLVVATLAGGGAVGVRTIATHEPSGTREAPAGQMRDAPSAAPEPPSGSAEPAVVVSDGGKTERPAAERNSRRAAGAAGRRARERLPAMRAADVRVVPGSLPSRPPARSTEPAASSPGRSTEPASSPARSTEPAASSPAPGPPPADRVEPDPAPRPAKPPKPVKAEKTPKPTKPEKPPSSAGTAPPAPPDTSKPAPHEDDDEDDDDDGADDAGDG